MPRKPSPRCPKQFEEILNEYLKHMELCGYKKMTVKDTYYSVSKTLTKFNKAGIKCVSQITATHIYDAFERKSHFSTPLRGFLHYLYKAKVISIDYSVYVPSDRNTRPIPSIYTKSETIGLLQSIDKSTDAGKRSYAIILLALRLGLRTGDIINLKMENVDFQNKEISFYQMKTQVPQRLELVSEVEEALLSYISTARPTSDEPNVFLSLRAPFKPVSNCVVYEAVTYHIKKAGINIGERHHGAHSLRATLASELVAEKTPYEVVRKILGHEDPFSIKHYVKFDIDALRSCALKVPPITGKLSDYMNIRSGVKCSGI